MFRNKKQSGFTIIEVVIGIGIFAILLVGVLSSSSILSQTVRSARERTVLTTLAANYLEIARNMPYNDVGTINGNPTGILADESNAIATTIEGRSYNIFYEVTYIDDSADGTIVAGTDTAPNDYKQVKLSVHNNTTGIVTDFITAIAPQGLEGLNNAGALLIEVFDANGQPVAGANVHIENTLLNPDIVLDRTTDSTGHVIEVGLPASVNGYTITVSNTGYSSDQTYEITATNPNPIKPHATVVDGQVTQVSFAIDAVATLGIRTVDQSCQAISGVDINLRGSKLIGTSPDVLKYDQDHTSNGSGAITLNTAEWDTYVPTLLPTEPYIIYGTSPVQQVLVLPGSNQTFTFVLGPSTPHSLRVIVKDAATGAPLEGATVNLTNGGENYTGTTGGSVWQQSDWSGGMGQDMFVNTDEYFTQDGNIDTSVAPTGLRLVQSSGSYVATGSLESSTFDTGGVSTFTTISWEPTSQNPQTELKFQVASNTDNLTWNYIGPDGTAATYYTVPGTNLHASHDGHQYIRYKAFLSTNDSSQTPVLTSVGINYVSGCFTPGQAVFPNVSGGSGYDLDISLSGYQSYSETNFTINGNLVTEVLLTPQ